ncbi:MAG TPA: hypothetical protein VGJ28_00160 [Micromonosporaceae bacterium]|jgi:hypothetical protein
MTDPLHSHRRPVLTGWWGRIGAVVLVLATLAIGARIEPFTTDSDAQQRPYVHAAAAGKTVSARTFTVAVLGVRGTELLTQDDKAHNTSGVWILVHLRLTAVHSPATVTYAALRDDQGRTYPATGRIDQRLLDGVPFEPGVPIVADLAFEVPASVATGLSIQLSGDPGGQLGDLRMDAVAQIRLPITTTEVKQWTASKTSLSPATTALAE